MNGSILDRITVTFSLTADDYARYFAMRRWAAVSRFTSERDLLLIWIGQSTAVAIPSRSFASDSACDAAKAFIRARLTEAHPAKG